MKAKWKKPGSKQQARPAMPQMTSDPVLLTENQIEDAVGRVLQQHSIPADSLLLELQASRLEAAGLREALSCDEDELQRLWRLIGA
jgi:hypothetical protein